MHRHIQRVFVACAQRYTEPTRMDVDDAIRVIDFVFSFVASIFLLRPFGSVWFGVVDETGCVATTSNCVANVWRGIAVVMGYAQQPFWIRKSFLMGCICLLSVGQSNYCGVWRMPSSPPSSVIIIIFRNHVIVHRTFVCLTWVARTQRISPL